MNAKQTVKGFTIIEVVLVLAIAGLIFLMVFIALPALQAGQRDTARKNDASIVSTAVTNYISNNRGTFPSSAQLQSYVKGISSNTTVTSITVGATGAATVPTTDGAIVVKQNAVCSAQDATPSRYVVTAGANRQFVVITQLEGGGGVAYCLQGS